MLAPWVYVDRGRDFTGRRVDCWGFSMHVSLTRLRRALPDVLDAYEGLVDTDRAVAAALPAFDPIPHITLARLGDVVLVHLPGQPFHAGLYTGDGHMIQLGRSGVTHPSILPGSPYGRRLEGIYRHAG